MRKEPEDPPVAPGSRRPWIRPELRYLGKLGELVQGGGKFGSTADGDPQATLKPGVG